jgi:hypothetical protein
MRPSGLLAVAAGLIAAALVTAGCQDDCCTIDSFPIVLGRAPSGVPPLDAGYDGGADAAPLPDGGALWTLAALPAVGPQPFKMVVDTASPFTILGSGLGAPLQTATASFDLYGDQVIYDSQGRPTNPLRADFRGWNVLPLPLGPFGDGTIVPSGVLGADLLHSFSVELRLAGPCPGGLTGTCPSLTFWSHLSATQSFLEDAGFAVLSFTQYGGGEVTADGPPDFLGLRGPLTVAATRVVLRACAVPTAFTPARDPTGPTPQACCTSADALTQSSGVDLSLLVDTGIGPLVLSATAWNRVVSSAAARNPPLLLPPVLPSAAPSATPLWVASWPTPIQVLAWAAIPRYALINLEAGANDDPGPCVELARARRTEVVSYDTVMNPTAPTHLCAQPCDLDPNQSGEAQNSAAYLEIGGNVPVAVISDVDPFLQGLEFDVLPEGPQLDGLVGAQALGAARVELDYLSSPSRAVFSCEANVPRSSCWAAARCPQLPDQSAVHYCFGLGAHTVPTNCVPTTCP